MTWQDVGMDHDEDVTDRHLDRWTALWTDVDGRDRETEGALFRMVQIQNASLRALRELLVDGPVTYEEFMTLHQLVAGRTEGPFTSTPARLAKHGGVTRAAVTGRVSKLVRKGFVTRSEDQNDRRHQVVTMTATGHEVWFELLQQWSAYERRLLAPLSVEDIHQLNSLMHRVTTAAGV